MGSGLDTVSAAWLVPIATGGNSVKVDKPMLVFGRHASCDVVLDDSREVSRRHCLLSRIENQILVRDLGSTNGVSINGRKVQVQAVLQAGDELAIANVRFRLLVRVTNPAHANDSTKHSIQDVTVHSQTPAATYAKECDGASSLAWRSQAPTGGSGWYEYQEDENPVKRYRQIAWQKRPGEASDLH